jgi:acetate kinase
MNILVLNGGSSSLKCWFHRLEGSLPADAPVALWTAHVEWAQGSAEIKVKGRADTTSTSICRADSIVDALPGALESLWSGDTRVLRSRAEIDVVGHRIVHGGRAFRDTTELTEDVRAAIAKQVEFAPAHNRLELELIQQVDRMIGGRVRQMAVFDTGFHETLAPEAYVYAGPYEWLERGIRRYGFHGINHRYASRRASEMAPQAKRMVICHLGSGCSLAAVVDGKSVDTTMGFTPLEGLVMATRSGTIDPAIVTYLMRHGGHSVDDIDRTLNQESGLKGISGLSGDMREIVKAMSGAARARLAFDVYGHRLCREIGAMAAVMGGLDALVFTGGVGEHCAPLRERVCRQFEFLGVGLDPRRNAGAAGDTDLTAEAARVSVLVITAQEEWEIARECFAMVNRGH